VLPGSALRIISVAMALLAVNCMGMVVLMTGSFHEPRDELGVELCCTIKVVELACGDEKMKPPCTNSGVRIKNVS
jgi:hypothetical protein